MSRREQLAPLQQKEAVDIHRRNDAFAEKAETCYKAVQRLAQLNLPKPPVMVAHVRCPG